MTVYAPHRTHKFEQLESLRGIAALVVLMHHFVLAFAPQRHGMIPGAIPQGSLMETPFFFLINGPASVSLFFVLSGYVLSFQYFKYPDKSLLPAVIQRWPRLVPVVLTSILLTFCLSRLGLLSHLDAAWITRSEWLATLGYSTRPNLEHATLYEAVSQGVFFTFFRSKLDSWFNSALWTMHIELLGSFLVFGLAATIRDARTKEALIAFATVAVLAYFADRLFPLFVAGACLAYLHCRLNPALKRNSRLLFALVLALIALGYHEPGKGFYSAFAVLREHEADFRVLVHGLAALALIHAAMTEERFHRFLNRRVFRFLGHISFPLYALHYSVLFSVSSGFFVFAVPRFGYTTSLLLTAAITLATVLPLSALLANIDMQWRNALKRPFRSVKGGLELR